MALTCFVSFHCRRLVLIQLLSAQVVMCVYGDNVSDVRGLFGGSGVHGIVVGLAPAGYVRYLP